ncbi:transcriptional regulator [candidate division KSB1 bacterium]|nr:transcriptional regulator [candidate division KSB1 bacterium]
MVTHLTSKLDKIFHDRVRLGVMSILLASEQEITFTDLVGKLELTRGNLSVHMKVLEQNGFVKSKKEFKNNKPRTTFQITKKGKAAFEEYLKLLEQIVKNINK